MADQYIAPGGQDQAINQAQGPMLSNFLQS